MKKLIITCLIIAAGLTSPAQTICYCPDLNKFVGTWRWTSGTDTVEIVFQKQLVDLRTCDAETLIGWHKYVQNGQVVETSMQYIGSNFNVEAANDEMKSTLIGATQKPDELLITFFDLTLQKNEELRMKLQPGSLTSATWLLSDIRGLYDGPHNTYDKFTLPLNLVLTKQ